MSEMYKGYVIIPKVVKGQHEADAIKGNFRLNAYGDSEADAIIKVKQKIDMQDNKM